MNQQLQNRHFNILLLFGIAGLILLLRAMQLQIIDDTFKIKADAVAMSKYTIYPARGLIYDRNGKLLTNNTPVYDLMVIYNQVSPKMDTAKFCRLLGIDKEDFKRRLNKDFKRDIRYSKIKPFVFMSKIPPVVFTRFQESLYEFPGFFAQIRNIRTYPVKNAAHVLGYITEVDDEDIKNSKGVYSLGDYIGASGLEAVYEEELRGIKGTRYVLKDNLGRDIGSFQEGRFDTLPQSGMDLVSSLDIELQAYAEELMQNKKGAVVAIEPSTGEILTFLSSPTYDPNLMVINNERGKHFNQLQTDSLKPLFNRAVMAQYPPGSIFKTAVGMIGMQMGVIQPGTGFPCPGYYANSSSDVRKCRSHPYPSRVAIGLQWSCNSYFFRTFKMIVDKYGYTEPEAGLDTMVNYLHKFGLGHPLGIDFPGEKSGNTPDSKYYDKIYPKERGAWRSPTIISLGIGQGEIELTTVQMANLAAQIANRGYYYIPHFARQFKNGETTIPPDEKYTTKIDNGIDKAYVDEVAKGMELVVAEGTARSSQIPGVAMAGKTGTVQNPHGEDHSTFIAFAPADNPKIAIAVYVENAGGGGRYAAPIASLIIEKYLKGEIDDSRKWREQQILDANLLDTRPRRVTVSRPAIPAPETTTAEPVEN
ncbi:MAG: penicillin-binding protein 2 [Saprospirales bacterium]|nr:penicillin-binding protein 2 [Saprospirales bacterium]